MALEYSIEDREILCYGDIGPAEWGDIDDLSVRNALRAMGGRDFTLRLNSPGGVVDTAGSIFNSLADYKGHITAIVDGIAASAASWILMAATERLVASNALIMIHSPWGSLSGNADDFEAQAQLLRKYESRILRSYVERSGQTEQAVREMLAAETWMDATEAVELGFADRIVQSQNVAAKQRASAKFPRRNRAKAVAAKLACDRILEQLL